MNRRMWIAPIQIIVAIALLINLLGYSALVGLGVCVVLCYSRSTCSLLHL